MEKQRTFISQSEFLTDQFCCFYTNISSLCYIFQQLQMLQVVNDNINGTDYIPNSYSAHQFMSCVHSMMSIYIPTLFDGEFWLF